MKVKRKQEKGITLIALVITIIVLLILAGVTLNIVMNTGITDNALKAKDISQISSYKDNIEIVKTGEMLRKRLGNLDTSLKDLVVESLKNEAWVSTVRTSEEESSLEENQIQVITRDNYILVAEIQENGTINYLVEDKYDGEPYPTISLKQLPLEGTENEKIKIEITASVTKGKKTKNIEKIEVIKDAKIEETKTYDKLSVQDTFEVNENGIYEFKVTTNADKTTSKKIFIDIHGTENIVEITQDTTEARNTIEASGQQNGVKTGPIKVTIEYGETDLTKEYQIGEGTQWQTTEETTKTLEIDKNTSISARYSDGTNKFGTKSIQVSNVDNEKPTIEDIKITTDKTIITVEATIEDTASENAGPNTKGIKEKLYSIDTEDYKEQNTFTVDTSGNHTIKIKAIDKAGNETIKSQDVNVPGYTLTVTAETGGAVSGDTTGTKIEGQSCTVTATPSTDYEFLGWYEENNTLKNSEKTYTFEMPANDYKLTAKFVQIFTVTVNKGEGINTVTVSNEGKVRSGESLTIKATLEEGYNFDKWVIEEETGTGEIAGATNLTTTITPESNVTVKATAKKAITEDNTKGTENKTYTGETPSPQNPVIPAGFKTKDTDDAKWGEPDAWNKGLVIEDDQGNEFVWVPVHDEKIGEIEAVPYAKWCAQNIAYTDVEDDSRPQNVDLWYASYDTNGEIGQVKKYGGFYIARYEAGQPSEETKPLSKQNQTAWVNISYRNSKSYAEAMYTGDNVKSGLVTGTMWDTTLKWLQNSGINVITDQTWGNKGSKIQTGMNDNYKKKNIYDLSGNVGEWINETKWNGEDGICRGYFLRITNSGLSSKLRCN